MEFLRTKLHNGMRVILLPMSDSPTVTVLAATETGALHESPELNGISHNLEHLCFKGTINRPTSQGLLAEMDGMGASFNAFTSHELTAYYVKARSVHLTRIIDLVADIYANPLLPADEIERERGVVIGEINKAKDQPNELAFHALAPLIYGLQPAGRPVLGSEENIQRFMRDDFVSYRTTNYTADAAYVIIAGGFDPNTALTLLDRSYLASVSKNNNKIEPERPWRATSDLSVSVIAAESHQTHIVIGFPTNAGDHEDRHIMTVLEAVIAGGPSTRIFRRMRNELGLGYYSRGGHMAHRRYGVFVAMAGVDNKRALEGVRELSAIHLRMAREIVPADELRVAKEIAISHLLLETSNQAAHSCCSAESMGIAMPSDEDIARIEAVTAEEVLKAAEQHFRLDNLHAVAVGPGVLPGEIAATLRSI
jgi:predicted Zn-dependent peptidase